MKKFNKLFICVLTVLVTLLYSGLPVKAEEQYTVTFDPNGGTMETIKTVTKTSGSTYGYLSGEGKHIASESDNEMLGYANYDFGSAITTSTKVSLDNFNNDCQTWFNNFEAGGFGFEYKKEDDCFNFEVYTNGAYHDVYIKRHFKEKKAFWITGVYDASADRMDVYINGELQTPYKSSHPSSKGNIKVSAAQLSDTGNPKAPSGYDENTQFYGTLYKAGLWTTAMTQEQISDMVNNDYINSAALINLDYAPRRAGYSFDGWYEDVDNPNTKITSTAKVTKNTTLHAKWSAHSYTVQYKPNGATSGTVADTTHSYNDDSTLAANSFQRTGYVFGGWNTKPDGSGKTYYSGQKVSNLTDKDGDTVTLYAVWAPDADVFNFTIPTEITASSDGTGKINGDIQFTTTTEKRRWLDVSITSGDEFALVDDHDSNNKINYSLSETSFKVEPQYTDSDSKSFTRDIKLSGDDTSIAGKYSDTVNFNVSSYYETRTITLDCNGGNVNGQSELQYTVKDGSSYGQLPVPSKNNYTFLKWIDNKGNTIYSGSVVQEDTQFLTAVWSQQYTLGVIGFINNQQISYTIGAMGADAYINGTKQCANYEYIYLVLTEGDTFRIDNFKVRDGYILKGLRGSKSKYLKYEYDENGNLIAVTGSIDSNSDRPVNVQLQLDFEVESEINYLLSKWNTSKLVIDTDRPSISINSIGSLSIFASKAEAYINEGALHIYNPDGGKVVAPESTVGLFSGCSATYMDLRGLDTSNVKTMEKWFRACSVMNSIDVSNWDVSKVKSMSQLFADCKKLQSIDLNTWNTASLTSTHEFFWSCYALKTAQIENLNVS